MGALFVVMHEPRVASHVGGQYRRQPALDPDWPLLHHGPHPTDEILYDGSGDRATRLMSLNVQGFGCRPMEMVQLAPGPASESRQRTNPRVMCAEGAALDYGDFAAGSGLLRLD